MKAAILALLLGVSYGQPPPRTCEYEGGPNNRYTLNLTSVAGYHLEYESPDNFYYYTPCTNGEICYQGNAEFHANAVQYQPGANQCKHYLSVDHHDRPQYFYGGASWVFQYADGEICDITQEPRRTNVWYLCDENLNGGAYMYDAMEPRTCEYDITIRTPLACVPENSHHANCQWKYTDNQNNSYYLDLSSQKGKYVHGPVSEHGYETYYSPCQNGLHCYQQTGGDITVMSISENTVTRTCDHYLSEWQEGRVEPIFHNSNDPKSVHWSFHYWLSQKCTDGTQGEQTIRWYCDSSVVNNTVINATYDGGCRWEMNLASSLACPSNEMYHSFNGLKLHRLKY